MGSSALSLHLHMGEADVGDGKVPKYPKARTTTTTTDATRAWTQITRRLNQIRPRIRDGNILFSISVRIVE